MNNFNAVGFIVADSEVRYAQDGRAILSFRIANDVGFGDKKHTNWVNCYVFGKMAEGWLKDQLKKGVKVIVNGSLIIKMAEKDGKSYLKVSMSINNYDNIHVCGNKSDSKPQAQSTDNFDNDSPF